MTMVGAFPCNRCGSCCGRVALTIRDVFEAADCLDMSAQEFFDEYCVINKLYDGFVAGKTRPIIMMPHQYCKLYDTEAKVCRIYNGRPAMCRMYPLHSPFHVRTDVIKHFITPYKGCSLNSFGDEHIFVPDWNLLRRFSIGIDVFGDYIREVGVNFDENKARVYLVKEMELYNDPAIKQSCEEQLLNVLLRTIRFT